MRRAGLLGFLLLLGGCGGSDPCADVEGACLAIHVHGDVGVGAGFVLGGRSVSGVSGYAGEVGHMVTRPDGPVRMVWTGTAHGAVICTSFFSRSSKSWNDSNPQRNAFPLVAT